MSKIWAHRGASAAAPENTMAAFKKAIEMGADGIEIDVHLSRDGYVVVTHDESTMRMTGVEGQIGERTLSELRKLDFAKGFTSPFERQEVPLLEDVLSLLTPTSLSLNIEIKSGIVLYPGLEKKVVDMVAASGMKDRVIYSSFNHYSLQEILKYDPSAKNGILFMSGLFEPWTYAKACRATAIHAPYKFLFVYNFVSKSHEAGMDVNVWTVDEPSHIAALMNMGVDAVITNVPDVAKKVREELGK